MLKMSKIMSIKQNARFQRLYKKGDSAVLKTFVIYLKKRNDDSLFLGITVTKKIGKAVVRNRIRRLIRESYRLKEDSIKSGYYIVIVARGKAAFASYNQISKDMAFLLKKSGLIES